MLFLKNILIVRFKCDEAKARWTIVVSMSYHWFIIIVFCYELTEYGMTWNYSEDFPLPQVGGSPIS